MPRLPVSCSPRLAGVTPTSGKIGFPVLAGWAWHWMRPDGLAAPNWGSSPAVIDFRGCPPDLSEWNPPLVVIERFFDPSLAVGLGGPSLNCPGSGPPGERNRLSEFG